MAVLPAWLSWWCSEVSELEQKTRWSRSEVLQLLHFYRQKKDRFGNVSVKNKTVWEEISVDLTNLGISCSAKMCETKMKNLKRSHVQWIDHKEKSGNDRMRKGVYYDELHDILAKDDNIEPQAVCSSIDGHLERGKKPVSVNSLQEIKDETPKKKSHVKRKNSEDMVTLFKEFVAYRKVEEKVRAERVDFMKRFLNMLGKNNTKYT